MNDKLPKGPEAYLQLGLFFFADAISLHFTILL